ncbi:hypothetical protein ACN263_10340 [Micromonospora sp. WMMD729]|uniref:hypothetical protein n=1 Tax=Micromonospora sp. WMMD729 TaxID=3404127 RepID=UPI003BF568FC
MNVSAKRVIVVFAIGLGCSVAFQVFTSSWSAADRALVVAGFSLTVLGSLVGLAVYKSLLK